MASKTDKASMTKAMKKAEALLREMVALTLRPDLTRNQRTNLETCVTVHMHQKETTGGPPRSVPVSWDFSVLTLTSPCLYTGHGARFVWEASRCCTRAVL